MRVYTAFKILKLKNIYFKFVVLFIKFSIHLIERYKPDSYSTQQVTLIRKHFKILS